MNTVRPNDESNALLREVDMALKGDISTRKEEAAETTSFFSARLPQVLRGLGALVLLGSAAAFLLQEYDVVHNHMARYYSFLAFTGVLGAIGFFCGLRMKEDKGARTFLALACAVVPANFCQLGALIYSRMHPAEDAYYPFYALLEAPSHGAAIVASLVGAAVLWAVTRISFSALIRRQAGMLTSLYLATNALLLLPTRDGNNIAVLLIIGAIAVFAADVWRLQGESAMKTLEGRLVRAMLITPLALLAARNLLLHSPTLALDAAIFIGGAVTILALRNHAATEVNRDCLGYMALIPAAIGSLLLSAAVLEPFRMGMHPYSALIVILPLSLVFLGFSTILPKGRAGLQTTAALLLAGAFTLQQFINPSLLVSFLCIVIGLAMSAAAYTARNINGTVLGGAMLLTGLSHHLQLARSLYLYSPWLSLALLGVATVLLGSYLERNQREVRERLSRVRNHFAVRS